MPDFPEVEVHIFDYAGLGDKGQYHWIQNRMEAPYWRIYWNDTPGGFVKVNNLETKLTPDKVVVLSPCTTYSTRLVNPVGHFYVHCSAGRPFSLIPPQLFELRDPELVRLAAATACYAISAHNNYRTQMRLHIYVCSVLLALPSASIPAYTQYDPRISLAITTLENNMRKSNTELAGMVNMSTNGFLQLFKQETGISPQAYSMGKRLQDAAIMLHITKNSIEEIAIETGFIDRYHFSRAFSKKYGLGPAEFRKSDLPLKDHHENITQE